MNNDVMKYCAIGCCVLYILLFLVLPVITYAVLPSLLSSVDMAGFTKGSLTGADVMGDIGWVWAVLVCGVAMGVCALLLPGKKAAIVSLAGAFIPLIAFLLIKGDNALGTLIYRQMSKNSAVGVVNALVGIGTSIVNGISAGAGNELAKGLEDGVNELLKALELGIGVGTILSMICGFGSAILCFLSDSPGKAVTRTPGLGSDMGDEW